MKLNVALCYLHMNDNTNHSEELFFILFVFVQNIFHILFLLIPRVELFLSDCILFLWFLTDNLLGSHTLKQLEGIVCGGLHYFQ